MLLGEVIELFLNKVSKCFKRLSLKDLCSTENCTNDMYHSRAPYNK